MELETDRLEVYRPLSFWNNNSIHSQAGAAETQPAAKWIVEPQEEVGKDFLLSVRAISSISEQWQIGARKSQIELPKCPVERAVQNVEEINRSEAKSNEMFAQILKGTAGGPKSKL